MMRPEELIPDLLRGWWIIVLAAIVSGVVGYVIGESEPETYSVSVRLVAAAEPVDYWLDLHAKNRLATYEPLINNHSFVQSALEHENLDIDPGYAQQVLRVSHTAERNTLTIGVEDSDPERAADIVNAIQFAFIRLNEEQNDALVSRIERDAETFTPRVILSSIETASPPTVPNATGQRSTVLAATLLGAIVGGAIVMLLIYRDDSLKTSEDLDRYIDRPLLGVVPDQATIAKR